MLGAIRWPIEEPNSQRGITKKKKFKKKRPIDSTATTYIYYIYIQPVERAVRQSRGDIFHTAVVQKDLTMCGSGRDHERMAFDESPPFYSCALFCVGVALTLFSVPVSSFLLAAVGWQIEEPRDKKRKEVATQRIRSASYCCERKTTRKGYIATLCCGIKRERAVAR